MSYSKVDKIIDLIEQLKMDEEDMIELLKQVEDYVAERRAKIW